MTTSDLDLTLNDIRSVMSELVRSVGRLDSMTRHANEHAHRQTRELAEARQRAERAESQARELAKVLDLASVHIGNHYDDERGVRTLIGRCLARPGVQALLRESEEASDGAE